MSFISGAHGELRYANKKVGKCRNFNLDLARETLETTGIGETDRTFAPAQRSATGSATILYDIADVGTVALLNSILNSTSNGTVEFIFDTRSNTKLTYQAIVTSVSTPVSVGEITACDVSFQITGGVTGSF